MYVFETKSLYVALAILELYIDQAELKFTDILDLSLLSGRVKCMRLQAQLKSL